jgi:hypothetical protein
MQYQKDTSTKIAYHFIFLEIGGPFEKLQHFEFSKI